MALDAIELRMAFRAVEKLMADFLADVRRLRGES
jgi:hypothetical protein